MALADFVGDDASLLIACQRILARQPTSGVMVWLIAHLLGAPNQRKALWDAVESLEEDSTPAALGYALPDGATVCVAGWSDALLDSLRRRGDVSVIVADIDGSGDLLVDRLIDGDHEAFCVDTEAVGQAMARCDVLVVELSALGPEMAIATQGTLGVAAVAGHWNVPVWGIARAGVTLPARMYQGLTRRWHENDPSALWHREAEEFAVTLLDRVVTRAGEVTPDQAQADSQCPLVPELY